MARKTFHDYRLMGLMGGERDKGGELLECFKQSFGMIPSREYSDYSLFDRRSWPLN